MIKVNKYNESALRFCLAAEIEKALSCEGAKIRDDRNVTYFKQSLAFAKVPVWLESEYMNCAHAATTTLANFEPKVFEGKSDAYTLFHNSGRRVLGVYDGRDIIVSGSNGDSFGVTIGKLPNAQDRPPLFYSQDGKVKLLDIADKWFNTGAMSIEYINAMQPIIDFITENYGRKWHDCFQSTEEKFTKFYLPVMEALKNEIKYQCKHHSSAPAAFVKHYFGVEDYYLISLQSSQHRGIVSAYGLNGKQYAGSEYAEELLPTELVNVDFKASANSISNTTLQLIFNNGWQMNLRLQSSNLPINAVWTKLAVYFKGSTPYRLKSEEFKW